MGKSVSSMQNIITNDTSSTKPYLIVTDLDGTLLDHHSYSWQEAKPALDKAKALGIPIIPCTSKTFPETQALIKDLHLNSPIICENGSGIAMPDQTIIDLAPRYPLLLEKLSHLKNDPRFKFWGFKDMTLEDVSHQTGLSLEQAHNAKQRSYSEPFLWQSSQQHLNEFITLASLLAVDVVQGGRFFHAISRGVSKQRAIEHLLTRLNLQSAHVIALGDSNNDIAMLTHADTAIVVNNPTRDFPEIPETQKNIHYTSAYGPAGWNGAITTILENYNG
jgi:mannosyl-3-phosphoglycerate phosphatase